MLHPAASPSAHVDRFVLDHLPPADAWPVLDFSMLPELERLAARRPDQFEFNPVDTLAADPCLIAFTSGTTGQPKGAVHTHRDVPASTALLEQATPATLLQTIKDARVTTLFTSPNMCQIEFLDALPRTQTGKLQRFKPRQMAELASHTP